MGDIPLDFDTLQPHGCFIGSAAVIILSQHDQARDAAVNLMRFFEHESCGQCTPCRVGTAKAAQLMEAKKWDQALARGALGRDGGCVDLRPRAGGAESHSLRREALSHEVLTEFPSESGEPNEDERAGRRARPSSSS